MTHLKICCEFPEINIYYSTKQQHKTTTNLMTKKIIIIRRKKKKKTTTRHKKMTAGMSFLMTRGLMERVRGFRMPRLKKITPKMLKNGIRLKDTEDIFNEEILYPALRRWNEYGYYDYNKHRGGVKPFSPLPPLAGVVGHASSGSGVKPFSPLRSLRFFNVPWLGPLVGSGDIVKYQKWAATKGSLKKSYVALRKTIKKMAAEGTLFYEAEFGEEQEEGIYNGVVNYVEEEFELYYEGLKSKKVWIEEYM